MSSSTILLCRSKIKCHNNSIYYSLLLLLFIINIIIIIPRITVNAYSIGGYPYIYPTEDEPMNSSYPVQDYIQKLTNYREVLLDKPQFLYKPTKDVYRIVEYYVHWCGRCRAFKSHYIAITRRIVDIAIQHNITIEVYAVSCTPNKPICIDQGVKGYPKVKIYQPNEILGYMVPFESFAPYYILNKFHIDITEAEMDGWDIDGAILDTEKDINHIIPTSHTELNNKNSFVSMIFGNEYMNDPMNDPNSKYQRNIIAMKHHRRTRNELKNDIHLSIDFIIRHGVYMEDGPIQHKPRMALHSFLHVMEKVLPSTWTHIHKLVDELMLDFDYATRTEQYLLAILDDHTLNNVTEWSLTCNHGDNSLGFTCGIWELLHAITIGTIQYNIISEEPYGTEMIARVIKDFILYFFPCDYCRDNFVKSFDLCEYNRCNRLEITVHGVQHGYRKPIKNKITGKVDVALTEAKYANVYNVTSGNELILWLFEVHNSVNVRLLTEKIQNYNEHIKNPKLYKNITLQDYINVLYPSYRECYNCWKHYNITTNNNIHDTNYYMNDLNHLILNYNREEIIQYLILEYGNERTEQLNQYQNDINEHYKHIIANEDERYLNELNIQHYTIHQKMIYQIFIYVGMICGMILFIIYILISKGILKRSNKKIYSHKKYDD